LTSGIRGEPDPSNFGEVTGILDPLGPDRDDVDLCGSVRLTHLLAGGASVSFAEANLGYL
jgi:hypothetical protein